MLEQWQRGFILHKKDYSESSLILDVFTENYGKIKVIAKGARNKNNKLKGTLQLFTPLLLKWLGKGSIKTLTHAEVLAITIPLHNKTLYSAFYVNELLVRLLESETEYKQLFNLYLNCLSNLAQYPENLEKILRNFELNLLTEIGFAINFNEDINNQEIKANQYYQYVLNQGFINSNDTKKTLFYGKDLLAIANNDYNQTNTQRCAKQFMRIILNYLLGNKPLKSRDLFQ